MSWNWLTRKFICIKINPRHSLKNIPPYYILLYNKDIKRSGFEKNDRRKNMNENAKTLSPSGYLLSVRSKMWWRTLWMMGRRQSSFKRAMSV